jgi:hypothetical protein
LTDAIKDLLGTDVPKFVFQNSAKEIAASASGLIVQARKATV